VTTGPYNAPSGVSRFQQLALIVGALFMFVFAIGFFLESRAVFSLLPVCVFFLGWNLCRLARPLDAATPDWRRGGLVIRRRFSKPRRGLCHGAILFVPIAFWVRARIP